MNILSENVGRYKRFPAFFFFHLPTPKFRVKIGPSATVSALLGIGEPALFGVILRYGMKPFLLSCSINGIAGMIAMLLGMKGTGNGITTIPGLLLYIYSPSQLVML